MSDVLMWQAVIAYALFLGSVLAYMYLNLKRSDD